MISGWVAGYLPATVCGMKGTRCYFCPFLLNKPKLYSRRKKCWSAFWDSWAVKAALVIWGWSIREALLGKTPEKSQPLEWWIQSQAKYGRLHQSCSKCSSWSWVGLVQQITWAGHAYLISWAWRRGETLEKEEWTGPGRGVMALACVGKWIWRMVTKRFWFSKNNAFHWLKPQLLLMQLLILLPLIPSFLVCMIQTYVNTSNGASPRWKQHCVKETGLMGAGDLSWKFFCPWDPLCILKQLLEWGVRYLFSGAKKRKMMENYAALFSCPVLSYETSS